MPGNNGSHKTAFKTNLLPYMLQIRGRMVNNLPHLKLERTSKDDNRVLVFVISVAMSY